MKTPNKDMACKCIYRNDKKQSCISVLDSYSCQHIYIYILYN